MKLILSFTALLLSIVLVQLSSGAMGPLDALSGLVLGFSSAEIGLLGSAHFAGFFLGCWAGPRMIGSVGHARSFAVFASLGAIGALGHILTDDPQVWAVLRVLSGMTVAGAYTVVETWFQSKVTNANRGRVLGIYRLVDVSGSVLAQLLIGILAPAAYASYAVLAILCCLSLLPLALSTNAPPKTKAAPRLRPLFSLTLSPLGAAGVIVAGLTMSAFRMVSPLYGAEKGLAAGDIGLFLAAGLLGGGIAQLPVGWLADRYDRRNVMVSLSVAALVISAAIGVGLFDFDGGLYLSVLLFGVAAFPIYSVAAAHANDFCPDDSRVELNAGLVFWFAVGAILSPYLASILLDTYGAAAFFYYIAAAHVVLIAFSLLRMRRRASPDERTAFTYRPRTSFVLQQLFSRKR